MPLGILSAKGLRPIMGIDYRDSALFLGDKVLREIRGYSSALPASGYFNIH